LLVGGCQVHEASTTSPVTPPGSFAGGGKGTVPDRWWQAFSDPTLNGLEQKALAGNFTLKTARDRLEAARAVVDRESAGLYPAIDLSVGARRQTGGNNFNDSGDGQFSAGLAAEYELDLWRRIDSTVAQAEFQQAARRADLKAAAITLTANVASTWYNLVEQRGQRRVLKEQIATNQRVLTIVRKRFARGQVRASDVLRQQRLLESTRQQREVVRSRIKVLKHQLLVLTGRSPTQTLRARGDQFPAMPTKPDPGLPARLVNRRPDVRSAFYEVQSADRAVAVAVADRYPRLTLTADLSSSDDNATDLFDDWLRSIAADLVQPVFDAGQREAEVRRTRSVKAQRLDEYGQAVLTAFEEVSNALSREYHQRREIRSIREQLQLSERTSERLRREYLNGDISYIDVLDALTQEQQLQRELLRARFALIDNRIALYRALAGGWSGLTSPATQPAASQPSAATRPASQPDA
jgi:NodT family efflux transporter outer membrane factor (OMF) lipoprotein